MPRDHYAETGQAWHRRARDGGPVDAITLRLIVTPELIAGADEDGAVIVYLYPAARTRADGAPDLRAYVLATPDWQPDNGDADALN